MRSDEGNLAKSGIPELFRSIASDHRSGCLTITRESVESRVFFKDGDVYQLKLLGSGARLGARLVSAGIISSQDLEATLSLQRSEGGRKKLVDLLISQGPATIDQIRGCVQLQIQDMVFELMKWEAGRFAFDEGVVSDEDVGLLLQVEPLIFEGAKRFREWYKISRQIPTLGAVAHKDDEKTPVQADLTPEAWTMFSKIDGSKTLSNLAYGCGFTDLEASRTLYGLVGMQLATVVLPAGIEPLAEDPELEQAFAELELALAELASKGVPEEPDVIHLTIAEELLDSPDLIVMTEEPDESVETEAKIDAVAESSESIHSMSREFAEISRATPQTGRSEPVIPVIPVIKDEPKETSPQKPIDPSVDTGALLREFSGLGLETEPEPGGRGKRKRRG
ncbi:MAG: DUF4388 domain-containing protein [Actinomycetota bacterium]